MVNRMEKNVKLHSDKMC